MVDKLQLYFIKAEKLIEIEISSFHAKLFELLAKLRMKRIYLVWKLRRQLIRKKQLNK